MMGRREIIKILCRLSYKGREGKDLLRINRVMFGNQISYDIMVKIAVKDRATEEETSLYSHYVFHPSELKSLTPSSLIRRIRSMLIYLESHEVDEQLLFENRRVFDPHSERISGPNVKKEKERSVKRMSETRRSILNQLKEKSK